MKAIIYGCDNPSCPERTSLPVGADSGPPGPPDAWIIIELKRARQRNLPTGTRIFCSWPCIAAWAAPAEEPTDA